MSVVLSSDGRYLLQQEFDEESRIEHTRRQYHRVDRPRVTPRRRVARPRSYGDDPNRRKHLFSPVTINWKLNCPHICLMTS